ncbi:hypothetical protein [Marinagarivorans cellulosilyticus]|uniref:Cytochrome c domain-containing protein n=1 Tax=Marinagarivorans cellulosilyticus TaxID=2721545 RepID=A0AAN1WGC7_9GAMM|nr:hypothetical protein [Marinagarivorans cellulosilyticus]BCD97101.1 hypothetical protein MARGE09_P1301 [Marinagarivorans cellulosilyticus]
MKNQTLPTIAKLSASGLLAVLITACGSSGSDDTNAAAPQSSAAAQTSSSLAASSSSEQASSVATNDSGVAESCAMLNGSFIECLDFENMSPGAVPSGFNQSGNGIAVVEGEGSYSGDLALKISGASASYLSLANFTGTHWGRMYYKNIAKPSSIDSYSHTTLVSGFDNGAQFRFVDMVAAPDNAADAGKYQHLYNTEPNDLSLEGPYDNSYDGEWVCVEWSMDTAAQEFYFYKDGNEVALANFGTSTNSTDLADAKKYNFNETNMTFQMTPVPAEISELRIGIQNYQQDSFTFLLDDIVIADARVGCDLAAEASSSEMSSSSMVMSSSEAASSSAPAVVVGKADFDMMCKGCHTGAPADLIGGRDQAALSAYINGAMPQGNPSACEDTCADEVASYILN